MRALAIAVFVSMFAASLVAEDFPVVVKDSGSKEVDALVLQLVAERPAPFRTGTMITEIPEGDWRNYSSPFPFMNRRVRDAFLRLKAMGPPIFPALVTHLNDDRYSYSVLSTVWSNRRVGDLVVEILHDGNSMHGGYKYRKTPTKSSAWYLSFNDYLNDQDTGKWADWAKDKSRLEIQLKFIDWCVQQEHKRGFVDDEQKKLILDTYAADRERIRKTYSAADAAENED